MDNDNKLKFIAFSNVYITNINSILRNIKSDVIVDFVCTDQYGIITINNVTSPLDLQTIKDYVKNANYIDFSDLGLLYFSQSKFYLKIVGISYLMENTNMSINSSVVETILKNNHIFNNILSTSKP